METCKAQAQNCVSEVLLPYHFSIPLKLSLLLLIGDRYHMFFCYKHGVNFRNSSRGYRIGYAYSDDLVSWHRDDTQAGLKPSKEGWDSESVSYPHVFELDGRIYMLYLGNEIGRHGFGLAELKS